ncbi:hypothetical protein LPB68_04740 [Paenibacillus crassostreae]|nr:hypothetical protein LPB68_04740 [Paenibacillus crassostreae]
MGKATLTKAQAEAVEEVKGTASLASIVRTHVDYPDDWVDAYALNNIPLDTLIRSLYIGYEVELTVEERLLEVYSSYKGCGVDVFANVGAFRAGMKSVCDIAGIQVTGITV